MKQWRRYILYSRIIQVLLAVAIIIDIFNESLATPVTISRSFFWLALGLYLGFSLCHYESGRVRNKK